MTRRSLRSLLLRAAHLLEEVAARKPQKPQRLLTAAKELRDAERKGVRT